MGATRKKAEPPATISLLLKEWKKPWHPPSGASSIRAVLRITTRLRFIEPQLASSVDPPPEGKRWIHEIKHDGYRCEVLLERTKRVFSPATDAIGATAIPLSSAPLTTSGAYVGNIHTCDRLLFPFAPLSLRGMRPRLSTRSRRRDRPQHGSLRAHGTL